MDLKFIDNFYQSDLGRYVSSVITDKISSMRSDETAVCSVGAYPFMPDGDHVFFQTYSDPSFIPEKVQGSMIQTSRHQWPYRAESVDMVVMAHDFEFAEERLFYMREAWRVLKGEGRLIIVLPNRKGRWIQSDQTPFGYGHMCHLGSIFDMCQRAHFKVDQIYPTLFFPPTEPQTRMGQITRRCVDRVGEYCGLTPGVRVLELSKHIYAPTRGLKEMVMAPAKKVLGTKATASSPKISK